MRYYVPSDLRPYARNAKKHDEAQVKAIAASIEAFGFNAPVLTYETEAGVEIVAGHGRVLAAELLVKDGKSWAVPGKEEPQQLVPTIHLGHLTPAQRRAYVLADNRLAEKGGGWDEDILKLELADLSNLPEIELDLTGFDGLDVAKLLRPADSEAITPSSEESRGAGVERLSFGKHKIPLSAEELADLVKLVDAYGERNGTTYGFGGWIVRRVNTAPEEA